MHDEIATDKNKPTVNAFGPIYAVSAGHGTLNVVDPVTNDAWKMVDSHAEDPRKVATRFLLAARPSNFGAWSTCGARSIRPIRTTR
ncbi:MAG: hypothetical protein IPM70_09180 [Proteobacteria bacterium]|nr:hypothetical protein [Pseudomonadota bacterium]